MSESKTYVIRNEYSGNAIDKGNAGASIKNYRCGDDNLDRVTERKYNRNSTDRVRYFYGEVIRLRALIRKELDNK